MFFFFSQKTSYDMRIIDWSSDVCSSDLQSLSSRVKELYNPKAFFTHAALLDQACAHCPIFPTAASRRSLGRVSVPVWLIILSDQLWIVALVGLYPTNKLIQRGLRSEEHTSELQSLMSISYAVFCLTKKI